MFKLEKKQPKSENSPKFDAKKFGSNFLTSGAKKIFNRFWLVFTKAPILSHFDPEYHIQIKINALGYAMGGMLSQLTCKTSLDKVVTKANLDQ